MLTFLKILNLYLKFDLTIQFYCTQLLEELVIMVYEIRTKTSFFFLQLKVFTILVSVVITLVGTERSPQVYE